MYNQLSIYRTLIKITFYHPATYNVYTAINDMSCNIGS